MTPISKSLLSQDYSCLFYADDIVVFSVNKSLNRTSFRLNSALNSLDNKLSSAFFEVAPDKSQLMIFTRKRYADFPPVYINNKTNNKTIVTSNTITFLGLILDSKLRWVSHFNYLKCIISKWSNLLRALAGTWWGAHPSPLLLVYKYIIRSKVGYVSFFIFKLVPNTPQQTVCYVNLVSLICHRSYTICTEYLFESGMYLSTYRNSVTSNCKEVFVKTH
jgi:hypothetical protein